MDKHMTKLKESLWKNKKDSLSNNERMKQKLWSFMKNIKILK